jgi:hypothetical protein
MMNDITFKKALKLFERQIECIKSDDRKAQMELYANNLHYEFPFANDRPRLIEGRETFQNIMIPLWNQARQFGVKVIGSKHKFHSTDEKDLYIAEFVLEVEVAGNITALPFIQLLRIQDDHIIEVREYFNPSERKELINQ